jgi:predicted dehydrogenase
MHLTEAQQAEGRKAFAAAIANTTALATLGGGAPETGPRRGGPVKAALIGPGLQGKILLSALPKPWIDLRALCDINPRHTAESATALAQAGWPRPRAYEDWREMLVKEPGLEAIIVATPLWTHADIVIGCLRAGKHVLCEKMMAWDLAGCHRMQAEAKTSGRLLEFGYHRFHSASYQASYEAIIERELLGDLHHVRAVWHRDKSWRRTEPPPSPGFDPRPHGYASWDHLVNWRLYRKYSRGLLAELGSHQISIANWYLGGPPEAVYTSGAVSMRKDGREHFDHVFSTFDYPGGRTVTFSAIESNAYDNTYEQFMGTKGTLVLTGDGQGYLFREKSAAPLAAAPLPGAPEVNLGNRPAPEGVPKTYWWSAYRHELVAFCRAVREGTPLRCGPEKALGSASACIRAEEAGFEKKRLLLA